MTDDKATAQVTIKATSDKVWSALTDPLLIKQYMGGANVTTDWKVGSSITYAGEWNGKAYEDKGKILEIEPESRLKTTHFSPLSGAEDVPENYHVLTWEVLPNGDTVDLRITQENNEGPEMAAESEKTWTMVLNGIKDLVEQ